MSTEISKLFVTIGAKTEDFQKGMEGMGVSLKKAGIAITAMGAGITAALGFAVKAAAEEEVGIERLRVAMSNAGLSYDDARESLEGWILAQQKSTAYADDQQREALAGLIPVVGNLTQAQELLATAMDLARWKNIDLQTATDILTRVYAGNLGTLSRYGIVVQEGATATEALAEIQKLAAGQAEAYGKTMAGQMEALKARIGDLQESVGKALIPILIQIVEKVKPIIEKVIKWIEENPKLAGTIITITAVLGGLMMVLGPLLMILPGLIAALPLLGVAFTLATGPVGIIAAAIAGLIAIGVALWKNWEKIKEFAAKIWNGIVDFFKKVWQWIVDIFKEHWDKILAVLFPAVGLPILIARNWEKIVDFVKDIFKRVAYWIVHPIEVAINWIIDAINWVIRQVNKLPFVEFGEIGHVELMAKPYQRGGIVTGPTLAKVGEAGPEAIIPLEKMGLGIGETNVYVTVMGSVTAEHDLAATIREQLLLIKNRNLSAGLA